jgi:hypothetical protein
MTIPAYLPYFVFTGTAATVVAVLYGLHRSLANADWPAPDQARTFLLSTVIILGWLAAAIGLAAMGVYHVDASGIPTIQYGILLPIVIGALTIWRSDATRRVIDAVPQQWIVGVQLYRALGFVFLILYATDRLPAHFAWPAGFGDIAIGLLAPLVGYAYARTPHQAAGLVRAWNLFGILDLIVAVGTGFMTAPSRFQPLEVQPTSELMTLLPMVLIPTFLVPLSIILHLASLAKLRWSAEAAAGNGNVAAARI